MQYTYIDIHIYLFKYMCTLACLAEYFHPVVMATNNDNCLKCLLNV